MREENVMFARYTIKVPYWLDLLFTRPVMIYRKLRYGYTYRRINLGEGEWTKVDEKDYYKYGKYKWVGCVCEKRLYAARLQREMIYGRLKGVFLHREIMNAPKGVLIDHENRDKLDNRSTNLRPATHSQNSCNRPKRANTSSRYLGVTLDRRCGRWEAQIVYQRKRIRLGRFDNEIDAARAYDEAAKKYHGQFAQLNFP
jgi:hypothetical protein